MKTRIISGVAFAAIIASFFALRQFVDARVFYFLIAFFCSVGTYEVARALKDYVGNAGVIFATVSGGLFVPAFVIGECIFGGLGHTFALGILAIIAVICVITQAVMGGIKRAVLSLVAILYPSILLLFMLMANTLSNGFIALLLIFVISPITDTMAYFTGMAYNKIRKGKAKKLCPKLSPKKTVAGALGGLVGGAVGGLIVYLIFTPVTAIFAQAPWVLFLIIGFVAAVFTQIGDLFESFIKRKVGLKDMGNIMPGHGGVMDRIDGITFAAVFIFVVFLFV